MNKRLEDWGVINCLCGKVIRATSWTDSNPERRFLGCPRFRGNGCSFFWWYDPPICARSKNITPGLVRRIHKLDSQVKSEIDEDIDEIIEDTTHNSWVYEEDVVSGQTERVMLSPENGGKKMIF